MASYFVKTMVIRQAMNKLFCNLWRENETTILNLKIDFDELANMTKILKRKNKVEKFPGLKYALGIYHNKFIKFNICVFYITLNDFYHPNTTPIKNVLDNLDNIKNHIENIEYLQEIRLTKDICNKLKIEISKRKYLYDN